MPKFDKHEEELMRLMFGLSESVAEAPPSEVLEEAQHCNANLLDEAEEVRGILRSAGRAHLQQKLRESRRAYEAAVEKCGAGSMICQRQRLRAGNFSIPSYESGLVLSRSF